MTPHLPNEAMVSRARTLAGDARVCGSRGDPQAALELFDRALALLESDPPEPLLADVLRWKGTIHRDRGETYAAQQLYERSLEVAAACGSESARGHALNCLGIIDQRRGDLELFGNRQGLTGEKTRNERCRRGEEERGQKGMA